MVKAKYCIANLISMRLLFMGNSHFFVYSQIMEQGARTIFAQRDKRLSMKI